MRKWPPKHRKLLIAFIVLTLLALVGARLLYLDWVAYTDARDEKASIEAKLIRSEWPKDPERLSAMLREYDKKLNKDDGSGKGMVTVTQDILARATSVFKAKIDYEYETKADFLAKASQTEYKDQFDRLDSYLQGRDVHLDTGVFGMNESTSEPMKYQMLLKLWTAQAAVDCALNAKLRVVQQRPGGRRPASQLCVLPMKSYYLNKTDKEPYLLEFPVQMELSGTLEAFSAFVDSLYTDGRFLPVTRMEITMLAPNAKKLPKPDKEGVLRIRHLNIRLVVSSFFMPDVAPQTKAKAKQHVEVAPKPAGI